MLDYELLGFVEQYANLSAPHAGIIQHILRMKVGYNQNMEEYTRATKEVGIWQVEDKTLASAAVAWGSFHVTVKGFDVATLLGAAVEGNLTANYGPSREIADRAAKEFYGLTVNWDGKDRDRAWVTAIAKGLVFPIDLEVAVAVGRRLTEIVAGYISDTGPDSNVELDGFFAETGA